MPAIKPSSNLFLHIFKPSDTSGFHSKAKYAEIPVDKQPQIHVRYEATGQTGAGLGFYLCGWNFSKGNSTGLKWSTMFPDGWAVKKVETAVLEAIEYWNHLGKTGTENSERVKKLAYLYGLGWVGNAKVDGKTCVLGGMSGNNEAESAFPLQGANANFPKVHVTNSLYPPVYSDGKQGRFR